MSAPSVFSYPLPERDALRVAITRAWLADEAACVDELLQLARNPPRIQEHIDSLTRTLVERVRAQRGAAGAAQAFLREYSLASHEGVVLMCLAEALLRIPDAETADRLIQDKLRTGDWEAHFGHSASLLVNASTWGLMLSGSLLQSDGPAPSVTETLRALVARSGEPVIRAALRQAMRILAEQFVMGRTIGEALARSRTPPHAALRHSFDMLGESALSEADARRYFSAYQDAIREVGAACAPKSALFERPGISVKLSALHPRYDVAHRERVLDELVPRVHALVRAARDAGINLTLDAEECARLELSLDVFEVVFSVPEFGGYEGFGLAVQAYQKRTSHVLRWLLALARKHGRRIPVRLVKGAYWDSEIKRAQEQGLDRYPVFTRKASTDVSYLACAKLLLDAPDAFYPQFATHNAHTVASILTLAGDKPFEFQRLHGMGEALHEVARTPATACRVYAPVGTHEDLLPYLVRRLLENGANTSFVHRVEDDAVAVDDLARDPVAYVTAIERKPHPKIPQPPDMFAPERRNSRGWNLHDETVLAMLAQTMSHAAQDPVFATPVIDGIAASGTRRSVFNPADSRDEIGAVVEASVNLAFTALAGATAAHRAWSATAARERARMLDAAAQLFEEQVFGLVALLVREAGKTIPDALAEVRETVDYCRYYAALARAEFDTPRVMNGPTGERNELALRGRGVFMCISPWNFPLAIFTGQIAAALAAGNTVLAKPARQTPLIAARAIKILHAAGVPPEALQFLPGAGRELGDALLADERVAGVAFTGSTETAWALNATLASRRGAIVPLIAETGGQNVMIADSSALPEQVVGDVLQSAFNSAGQRCSALRVLFVQDDISVRVLHLLADAMGELQVGDPRLLATDVGPVIDQAARITLEAHIATMHRSGLMVRRLTLPPECERGSFVAPAVFEIESLDVLEREVFGPVLHVVRYAGNKLDAVLDAVNRARYGLTLGVHSRIDATIRHIVARARVGNIYVNRNMIGAVVGVQPFGGEGLSGTGPKAGGPYYLHRFATERTVTVNTSAVGGNTALAALGD